MGYYNLKIVGTGEILSDASAATSSGALGNFGEKLGVNLTFENREGPGCIPFAYGVDS